MAKHKVSELEGALLDAAVAKAEGVAAYFIDGKCCHTVYPDAGDGAIFPYEPSRQWSIAGPIIERARIAPQPETRGDIGNEWADQPEPTRGWQVRVGGRIITGPTYLIAAMRAHVAGKFGEEMELP